MTTTCDTRAGELLALAIAEGIDLPMSVDEIIAIEDAGGVVDLLTGEVLTSVTCSPTVLGETWALLNQLEVTSD